VTTQIPAQSRWSLGQWQVSPAVGHSWPLPLGQSASVQQALLAIHCPLQSRLSLAHRHTPPGPEQIFLPAQSLLSQHVPPGMHCPLQSCSPPEQAQTPPGLGQILPPVQSALPQQ
jgi:hypothetical protein